MVLRDLVGLIRHCSSSPAVAARPLRENWQSSANAVSFLLTSAQKKARSLSCRPGGRPPSSSGFEPGLCRPQAPPPGNGISGARDKRAETASQIRPLVCRDQAPAACAANSGRFATRREISLNAGMRGGVRSRICLHLQFPAIREINREFCDFRASGGDFSTKSPCAAVTSRQIPYAN